MIQIKDVCFKYENAENNTLKNINLHIRKGECVLLCGKSGSGKTAVTRLVNGLIPHFYEGKLSGQVIVDRLNVSEAELYETARRVGSVFQNPRSQFFCVDTTSEIAFGCENMGIPEKKVLERINCVSRELEITNLLNRDIFSLSGGEKQKIACASVSAFEPDVIVLDEPTSNLDVTAIEKLKDTLLLWKAQGKTIVIAEHRLYWLLDICDRVIYMKDGEIAKDITMPEFTSYSPDKISQMGLRTLKIKDVKADIEDFHSNSEIHLQGYRYYYDKKLALDIPSLTIPLGAVIAVIGHNGVGKSTFSKCLTGLMPKFKGITYIDIEKCNRKQMLKKCYLVMQDVNHQLFCESVEEEVALGMSDNNDTDIHELLHSLDLFDVKERHPMSLSGGQKQRTAIASAILAEKDILIFDEPTSGLDYKRMEQTAELIKSWKYKKTQFIVTHDVELICKSCTHILHISNGKVKDFYPLNSLGIRKLNNFFA